MSYDGGDNTFTVDDYSNTYGSGSNDNRDYGGNSFGGGDDKSSDTWKDTKDDDDNNYGRKDSSNDNTPEITAQDELDNSRSTLFSPVMNALMMDDNSIMPDLDYREKMNGDSIMKPMLSDDYNKNQEYNEDNNCSAADCCYYTVVCCDCTIL